MQQKTWTLNITQNKQMSQTPILQATILQSIQKNTQVFVTIKDSSLHFEKTRQQIIELNAYDQTHTLRMPLTLQSYQRAHKTIKLHLSGPLSALDHQTEQRIQRFNTIKEQIKNCLQRINPSQAKQWIKINDDCSHPLQRISWQHHETDHEQLLKILNQHRLYLIIDHRHTPPIIRISDQWDQIENNIPPLELSIDEQQSWDKTYLDSRISYAKIISDRIVMPGTCLRMHSSKISITHAKTIYQQTQHTYPTLLKTCVYSRDIKWTIKNSPPIRRCYSQKKTAYKKKFSISSNPDNKQTHQCIEATPLSRIGHKQYWRFLHESKSQGAALTLTEHQTYFLGNLKQDDKSQQAPQSTYSFAIDRHSIKSKKETLQFSIHPQQYYLSLSPMCSDIITDEAILACKYKESKCHQMLCELKKLRIISHQSIWSIKKVTWTSQQYRILVKTTFHLDSKQLSIQSKDIMIDAQILQLACLQKKTTANTIQTTCQNHSLQASGSITVKHPSGKLRVSTLGIEIEGIKIMIHEHQ